MPNGEANVNLKFLQSEHRPSSLPVQTGIQRGKARPFDLSAPFDMVRQAHQPSSGTKLKAPRAQGPDYGFA